MKTCLRRTAKPFIACALPVALALSAPCTQLAWHVRAPEILGAPILFMGAAYGQGIFVAVAYDGTVGTSADGTHWYFQKVDALAQFPRVAYACGKFVATAGLTNLLTSPDGTNWVQQPFPIVYIVNSGLSSTKDRFWLSTRDGPDQARILFTSTTGTNWLTSAEEFFWGDLGEYDSVAFGGGRYVCVGWDTSLIGGINPSVSAPTIIISADRTNWITEWTGEDPTAGPNVRDGTSLERVIYGENLFVAVGSSLITGKSIWYSNEGTNWTSEVTSFPSLKSVAYGDGVYVAVGGFDNGIGIPGVILTSTDGKRWNSAPITSTNSPLGDVAYGQNTFVAVGSYGQIFQSDPIVTLKTTSQPGELLVRGPVGQTCTIEAAEPL